MPPEQHRRMTNFPPGPAALTLCVTASLGSILTRNPGWRLRQWFAASVLFWLAVRAVLFDRRNWSRHFGIVFLPPEPYITRMNYC
jgi:hypothetical protein